MTRFETWWEGVDNPCKDLSGSTKEQMKPYMRIAFAAGSKSERNKRVIADADIIEARHMFKGAPEI